MMPGLPTPDALATRRDVVPVIEAELTIERQRHIEARGGSGGAGAVEPILAAALGEEGDVGTRARSTIRMLLDFSPAETPASLSF